MTTDEFLHWEAVTYDTIDVKRIYIDIAGDLVTGVLLSQIIYWFLPSRNGSPKTPDMTQHGGRTWLMRRRLDWQADIRISPKQFDRAKDILIQHGLVQERKIRYEGAPTMGLSLELETLAQKVHSILTKGENGTSPKVKMELDERVKWNFPKGQNGTSPKVKMELDERAKSFLSLKTKRKTKDKTKNPSPLSPPHPVGAVRDEPSSHVEPAQGQSACMARLSPAGSDGVEQGRLIFAELLQENKPNVHPNLETFLRTYSLEELRLLVAFDRDVLYREDNGRLTSKKRSWINPKTTCAPDHVSIYLPKAQAWAAEGKPLSWQADQGGGAGALGLSRKTATNLQNTANWGAKQGRLP